MTWQGTQWAVAQVDDENEAAIAAQIGWISDPQAPNLCGGYYLEPGIGFVEQLNTLVIPGQTVVTSAGGHFSATSTSELTDGVILDQIDRRLQANRLLLKRDPKTNQIHLADLQGDVRLLSPGHLLISQSAQVYLQEKRGITHDSLFRVALSPVELNLEPKKLYQLNAWGKAVKMEQLEPGQYLIHQGTLSTCPPGQRIWHLYAKSTRLDQEEGQGTAHHTILFIKDVPVFYTPYLSFPIDKRRKSGFLYGTYGYFTNSGLGFSIPYYWNLAPNYDLLTTLWVLGKRGVLLDGYFRYLTHSSYGTLQLGYLPGDKAFREFQRSASTKFANNPLLSRLQNAKRNRWLVQWQHSQQFTPQWRLHVDFNRVSDDYFIQDLRGAYRFDDENRLIQQIDLNYNSRYWNFLARLHAYQTLHPLNQPAPSIYYNRLPQLSWTGFYPKGFAGLDYHWQQELVYFDKPKDPITGTVAPSALRINIQPGISWTLTTPAGFLIPRLQFQLTHYEIKEHLPGQPSSISRALPILDIHAGLTFTRDTRLFNRDYEQTLEPQLYYVYIPFTQQNSIPLFDSELHAFNFDQLFRPNRFTGLDRTGDTHQITAAVTTRLLDQHSGAEKFTASIGQIYYLRARKVTLCNTPGCQDIDKIGKISQTTKYSPIVGKLTYRLHEQWYLHTEATVDPNTGNVNQSQIDLQYRPADQYIINFGYSFIRNGDERPNPQQPSVKQILNLSQTNLTFVWPLKDRWQIVGRWNYNLTQRHTQTIYSGIEYSSCCWGIRLLAGRNLRSYTERGKAQFDNTIYLQFELKGLGSLGTTNVGQRLAQDIVGYRDNFGTL